jgi:hypothetical protein
MPFQPIDGISPNLPQPPRHQRPNGDLFTTVNVRSHIVMAELAKPRLATSLKMHQPAAHASINDVPVDQRIHMDGLLCAYWPTDAPFPPESAEPDNGPRAPLSASADR